MERSEDLFISTPLKTPFILDNQNLWPGVPFDIKIRKHFDVTPNKADSYLQYCMKKFSNSVNIEWYKQLDAATLLNECINEINKTYYGNSPKYYINHSGQYHVSTNVHQTRNHLYEVDMESDDELPPPTTHLRL
jgi:hypothetical protein